MSNDGLAKENNIDWSLDNRHMWENTYGKSPNEKVYNYSVLEAQREIAEQLKRIADNLEKSNQPSIITKAAGLIDESSPLFSANMDIKIRLNPMTLRTISARQSSIGRLVFKGGKSFMDYFTCSDEDLPKYILGCPIILDKAIKENAFEIDNPKNLNVESHIEIIKDAIRDSNNFGRLPKV